MDVRQNAHVPTQVARAFQWRNVTDEEKVEALDEEFRSFGGGSVSDKTAAGRLRNQGSITLEWTATRPTAKPTSTTDAAKPTSIANDDVIAAAAFGYKAPPVAGTPVELLSPERKFVADNYGLKSKRMALHVSQHWTGRKPFGVDPEDDSSRTQTEYNPKSLADILQKKKSSTATSPYSQPDDRQGSASKQASLSLAAHLSKTKL